MALTAKGTGSVRLVVKNLGPVRQTSIDLRDLTILTGYNNTGKSVVATVTYAALNSMAAVPDMLARQVTNESTASDVEIADELDDYLVNNMEELDRSLLSDRVQARLREKIDSALLRLGEMIVDEIERVYGSPIQDLRRRRKRPLKGVLELHSQEPRWTLAIELLTGGPRISVKTPPPFDFLWLFEDQWADEYLRKGAQRGRPADQFRSIRLTVEALLEMAFLDFPPSVTYLPAARSGIMQAQKSIAGSIIRQSSYALSDLSGVTSDFLSQMIELDTNRRGSFADLADELESQLLRGRIVVSEADGRQEYSYQTGHGSFPVPRTSSMVSEIVPIVLFLRYDLLVRDLIIIEEPEAHLHPATQVELAKAFIKMIGRGLKLMVTTHSEFFLQQLSNSIAESELRNSSGHVRTSEHDTLSADRVSAYWFDEGADGVTVETLEISATTGIPEESFGEVAESLHNEAVRLELARVSNA